MLSFQFQYRPFFEVSFGHEYFQDKLLHDFKVVPDGRTQSILHDMGMLFKESESGFVLLLDSIDTERLSLKFEKLRLSEIKLRFILNVKEAFFQTYTDVSHNPISEVYAFSNSHLLGKVCGVLHDGNYVSETNIFNVDENFPDINLLPKQQGSRIALIDLELNEEIISGVLSQLLENELPNYSYNINFAARNTTWRYIVIPDNPKKSKDLSIVSPEGDVKFSAGSPGVFNKNEVVVFEAKKEIKFQQYYNYEFQLKRGGAGSGGKILKRQLQYAPINSLTPTSENKHMYFSDILTYI